MQTAQKNHFVNGQHGFDDRNTLKQWKTNDHTKCTRLVHVGTCIVTNDIYKEHQIHLLVRFLGYTDIQSHHNSSECPSNMYGILYYWNNHRQKSCTMDYSSSDTQFLYKHCGDKTNETFLSLVDIYSHENSIPALENSEYVDIVEPKNSGLKLYSNEQRNTHYVKIRREY